MCKKCRVIYPKCGHKITDNMEYCMPWGQRQYILNENGECPNDVLSISIDVKHLCQRCEDSFEAEKAAGAKKSFKPVVLEKHQVHFGVIYRSLMRFENLVPRCIFYEKMHDKVQTDKFDLGHRARNSPKPKPPKPFEAKKGYVVNHIETLARITEKEEPEEDDNDKKNFNGKENFNEKENSNVVVDNEEAACDEKKTN